MAPAQISKPRNQPPRLIKCAIFWSRNSTIACSTSVCVAMSSCRTAVQSPRFASSVKLALWRVTRSATLKLCACRSKIAPEVLDAILLFARDEKKTVGNESTENERHLLAACVSRLRIVAAELIEGERFEFVQLLKDARNRWRCVSIHAEFFALVILLRHVLFLGAKRREILRCKRGENQRDEGDRREASGAFLRLQFHEAKRHFLI